MAQTFKAVQVFWKCTQPSAKRFPGLVQFCERTVVGVAETLRKDEAHIRAGPHKTTRIDGKLVKAKNHITADFIDSETKEGVAAHIYVDESPNPTQVLPSTAEAPNPKTWPLPKKE